MCLIHIIVYISFNSFPQKLYLFLSVLHGSTFFISLQLFLQLLEWRNFYCFIKNKQIFHWKDPTRIRKRNFHLLHFSNLYLLRSSFYLCLSLLFCHVFLTKFLHQKTKKKKVNMDCFSFHENEMIFIGKYNKLLFGFIFFLLSLFSLVYIFSYLNVSYLFHSVAIYCFCN